jgi:hypothetical protein
VGAVHLEAGYVSADYGDNWAQQQADERRRWTEAMQDRRFAYRDSGQASPAPGYPEDYPGVLREGALPPARRAGYDDDGGYGDDPAPAARHARPGEMIEWLARHKRDSQEKYDAGAGAADRAADEALAAAEQAARLCDDDAMDAHLDDAAAARGLDRLSGFGPLRQAGLGREYDGSNTSGSRARARLRDMAASPEVRAMLRELNIACIGHEPGERP